MCQEPPTVRSYRRRSAIRLFLALIVLALGFSAFVARAFHVGRAWTQASPAPEAAATASPPPFAEIGFDFGRGYDGPGWRLYFNEPDEGVERADYAHGLDEVLAAAIDKAERTLDFAAFELNSDAIRDAIAAAHERGLAVRIVTDDDHGLNDKNYSHLRDLRQAGIGMRDDARSGLMHNKFVIIDQKTVWTGSWNYTVNGSYRNNNNALVLENAAAAAAYQAEFDEMFVRGEFGKRSRDDGPVTYKEYAGNTIKIVFAPEADEIDVLRAAIAEAQKTIRFMTFVFSLQELADAMLLRAAQADVEIQGVFENRNSTASWSQLPALHCAGALVRQDGNRYVLHHKVIIIDDVTVITGSFNFSRSAAESNDENIVIIRSSDIAGLYIDEFRRIWDSAEELPPAEVTCD